MDGIDRTRIDAIILRESGNSKFIQQQRKRDELVNEKIEKLRSKLRDKEQQQQRANHSAGWKTKIQHQMEGEIAEILASRPVRSTCVVVDMYVNVLQILPALFAALEAKFTVSYRPLILCIVPFCPQQIICQQGHVLHGL
jgi:hypothetical protein